MHDADVIIGVKEIPPRQVISGKTHLCFSHTHKGQNHNLTTLKEYVAKGASLVDYELLTDETGKRLVAFGKFAGYAGFIDCLHGLGLQLLKQKNYRTPFLVIYCFQYLLILLIPLFAECGHGASIPFTRCNQSQSPRYWNHD